MAHGEGGPTMGGKIWMIIFAIIVLGVIVYLWNAGLISKGTTGLESLFPVPTSTSAGSGTTGGLGGPPAPPPITYFISPSPTSTISSPSGVNPLQIPPGFTAAQLSPYFKEVTMSHSYSAFGSSPFGQITLHANVGSNETIDVTGWELKANHGSEFIPQAVEVYQPSGFASPSDIRLGFGQTLYLYSSAGTINLRLNECIGYMQKDLNTNPKLPLNCPAVSQSQLSSFTGACQNYIRSIPACTVPNGNSLQIPQNDYACQQFLNTLNYTGCFNAHLHDANFLSNQWWVWTGNNIADPYHDIVQLYDKSGLLVDEFSY